jgi:streptogramin lyase
MPDGIPEYDELKLRIEPGEAGGYRVTAFGPGDVVATGRFTSPLTEEELDDFIQSVGLPRQRKRGTEPSHMDEVKNLGERLLRELLTGDVGDVYQGARWTANSRGRGLRLSLSLTGVPRLMELPWEFVYARPENLFLAQGLFTPLVRSLDLKTAPAPRSLELPLRILALASSPSGFKRLDVEAERAKLESALAPLIERKTVMIDWLESATLAELDMRIGAPDELHVLHYIGHGAYDHDTQTGVLVLEDDRGKPDHVSGDRIAALVHNEPSLRLVVLNTCEGARVSHVDPFSGVATSLLRAGLPAVIGMQMEITDEAAITFSSRLYTALAQGYPIDGALALARTAIFISDNDLEFGTPVLFLRSAQATLFDVSGFYDDGDNGGPRLPRWLKLAAPVLAALAATVIALVLIVDGDGDGNGGTQRIPVGVAPAGVAVSPGAVWTSNSGSGSVTRIDSDTLDTEEIQLSADARPSGIAVGVGAVWVTNPEASKLVRIDPATDDITNRLTLAGSPSGVAVGAGYVWVALRTRPARIVKLDPRANPPQPVGSFDVPNGPQDLKVGHGAVWVTSTSTPNVTRIDLADDGISQIPTGSQSYAVAVGGGSVWATNHKAGELTRIDPVERRADSRGIPVGQQPDGVAADGSGVWVVNKGDDRLVLIDPRPPYHQLREVKVGESPSDVALGEDAVWVVNLGSNSVSRVEP